MSQTSRDHAWPRRSSWQLHQIHCHSRHAVSGKVGDLDGQKTLIEMSRCQLPNGHVHYGETMKQSHLIQIRDDL